MNTTETVNRAITYIMEHIGEDITLEDVAAYCHYSKYYFSRIFKAETGESPYSFIKRTKLEQSAFHLKIERNRTILDIGYDYGYSPSNYSSAFKQQHKERPADFRRNILKKTMQHPFFHAKDNRLQTFEECDKLVTIETSPDINVIYERRKGSYRTIAAERCAFMEKYREYVTPETLILERTFDDPVITGVDNCMYYMCISAPENCPLENTTVIKGGKFAVYHFDGSAMEIYAAYQSLFGVWLPQSGCEIDERYSFEIYRAVDMANSAVKMDIYIPVK